MSKRKYEIKLEVEVDVPDFATDEEIESYLKFETGYDCSGLKCPHPVFDEAEYDVKYFDMYEL